MLLGENLQLQESIHKTSLQMQRQKEQLQQVVANTERQLVEANRRLAWTQTQGEKRTAAEYLVEQIRVSHQERDQMLQEN